ncbi:unnamed protein product [Pieris brassicae]|uniref:Uncharacterized protein n=1 Tax=Pieris brassicae TaxID=7116 RepID=A0A9P0TBI0_PIEBR|nr:unnamed protein product [Pieris brassicae]
MVGSAGDVCKTRSGLEVLLNGFKGLDPQFDITLENLADAADIEDFDRVLKVWIDSGHRPDISPKDIHSNTPQSHWWWF